MKPVFLFLSFFVSLSLISGCSVDSAGGYGYHSNKFETLGWIKLDHSDSVTIDANRRIAYEQEKDHIGALIRSEGWPDYYMAADLWDIYYGYLNSGFIYRIDSKFGGRVVKKIAYRDFAGLPAHVHDDFEQFYLR